MIAFPAVLTNASCCLAASDAVTKLQKETVVTMARLSGRYEAIGTRWTRTYLALPLVRLSSEQHVQLEQERYGRRHVLQLTVPIEVPLVKKGAPSVLLDQFVLRSSDDGWKSECQDEDGICRYHLFKTTGIVSAAGEVPRG